MTGLQQRLKETEAKARRLLKDKVRQEGREAKKTADAILSDALNDFEKKLQKIKLSASS